MRRRYFIMPYVKSMDRDQLMMTTLDMLVDQDSIVRVMDAFVDSLDLQKLGFHFAEPGVTGRPAYNPAALLKLYIYGYKNSVRSSRKLQHECHVNLEVRWLTGGLEPDFRTISDFRKNNADALVRVFNEFNKIFRSYLLNGFVSIDGSKFLANNSKDNNFTLNKLDDRITWLENHCKEYLRQMENADKEEELPGQFTKEELDRKLSEAQKRLEKYKGYRKYMEDNNLSQLSFSDVDAKLMKTRNGFSVAHNVQTVVDSDTHLIVESHVTSNPTDYGELYETLKPVRDTLPDDKILEAVADKGYQSETDMVKCLENGIIPHVIPDDGKDTYELTMDYQENETDPSSSNINDINTCLHAGVLPEAYREAIDSISISEKKVFEEPDLSNLKSPFQSEEEMLAKAKDGYFVRDPERNLVICPAGNQLRQNQVTRQGFIRYINKMACRKCPHRNKCHNSKKGFKEIEFRKDEFVKPHRQWLKCDGKKSDIKSRRRKTVLKKVVTIIFRPNREKMAQRMCLSEHPFGTLKRIQGSYYFLLRGNRKTQGEFALFSLGYNLQRLLNHLGFKKVMKQLISTGCFCLNFCTIFIIQQLNHSTLELA